MNILTQRKIVLFGMMSRHPVPGVIWQTVHYLVGFQRLGYDVYYVEAHAGNPSMFYQVSSESCRKSNDDGSEKAAAFINDFMQRFGLGGDHWCFQALHSDGRCYGLSESELKRLYQSAALLVNLHGATIPRPEHYATGRLIYLETDPVTLQIELAENLQGTIDFLEPHCAFFTFGENYGNSDCRLPVSERFCFKPTRQPVILGYWSTKAAGGDLFTTIGNWRQQLREITFQGEVYYWSKHLEFLKFIDLPQYTSQPFELALSRLGEAEQHMLEQHGWKVRNSLAFASDADAYRQYIANSRGEFTVAKDQNVRLRSGWFSDRSATYLAAGRPVITQETGFSNILPSGEGLFAFLSMEDIISAIEHINSDYERHCSAAYHIARDYFNYDVVLSRLLVDMGLENGVGRVRTAPIDSSRDNSAGEFSGQMSIGQTESVTATDSPFPPTLTLTPLARRPVMLPDETVQTVLRRPIPSFPADNTAVESETQRASIVIVTYDNLVFTRICLESVLANTEYSNYEIIVVDNASTDGTITYLSEMAQHHPGLRIVFNDANHGFAVATNQGLTIADGEILIILNNDTIVPQAWLTRLVRHLNDPAIGLVGPVTNRIGNEAEIETTYCTYGEFEEFAQEYMSDHQGEAFNIRTLCMFCLAVRRDVYECVGPLDEQFEVGMFEDDDYAMRVRAAGYQVVCVQDVFVHHFGEASFGKLAAIGQYGQLFDANRCRFEKKWATVWEPHDRQFNQSYLQLINRIREVVNNIVPPGATVLVVSKGDDMLLDFGSQRAEHFPQDESTAYAGYYPTDSVEAIAHLEALRTKGADFLLFPSTGLWWLEHYIEFKQHLESHYDIRVFQEDTCVLFELKGLKAPG